jgi:hypothetical protein
MFPGQSLESPHDVLNTLLAHGTSCRVDCFEQGHQLHFITPTHLIQL